MMLGRIAGFAGALIFGLAPTGFTGTAQAISPPPGHPAHAGPAADRSAPRDWRAPLTAPTAIWALNVEPNTALAVSGTGQVRIAPVNSGPAQQWTRVGQTIREAAGQKLCLNVQGKYAAGAKLIASKCGVARSERFVIATPSAPSVIFFVKPAANTKLCMSFPLGQASGAVRLAKCASVAAQAWSAPNLTGVAGPIATTRGALTTPAGGKAGPDVRAQAEPLPGATSLSQYWYVTFGGSLTWDPQFLPVVHPVTNGAACLGLAGAERNGTPFVLRSCTSPAVQPFLAILMDNNSLWVLATPDGRHCMRIAGNSGAGQPVVLGSCAGTSRDLWATSMILNTNASARYSRLYLGTGSIFDALTLTGAGAARKAVLEPRSNAVSQLWTPVAAKSSPVAIMFQSMSDPGTCLTVSAGVYAPGTQIIPGRCAGAAGQLFLRAASGRTPPGDYTDDELMPYASGNLCLTAAGGVAPGHVVRLEPCDQNRNQAWSTGSAWFGWGGAPTYFNAYPVIFSELPSPGPLLAISKQTAAGAQAVLLSTVKGAPAQMWVRRPAGNGFSFSPAYDTGWCLTAPGTSAGTALVLQACDGSASQKFNANGTANPQYLQYRVDGLCLAAGTASQGTVPAIIDSCSAADTAELWWNYPAG
jgi:hypothetical protein